MLLFITSVRHPFNSNDYKRVLWLLNRTLSSVCGQDHDDYAVLVVHNESLPVRFVHPRVNYVSVSFPPASVTPGAQTSLDECRLDKGLKYLVGLIAARELDPEYVMFFDSDDYLNCALARFAAANPGQNGWFGQWGYVYRDGSDLVRKISPFHHANGSSLVLRYSKLRVPTAARIDGSAESLLEVVDRNYVMKILGSHRFAVDHFAAAGHPLLPLPFASAIWVLGTGENHSGTDPEIGSAPQALNEDLVREFHMQAGPDDLIN